jgi:prevent-host-death family protein
MKRHPHPPSPPAAAPEITISCSELRRHLGRYLVLVQTESARVTVARYGRPSAVLGSLDPIAASLEPPGEGTSSH